MWEAAGRALLSWGLGWGLFRRLALFRTIASVYCLVMLLTYLAVLGLAYSQATAVYPEALIIESVYEIPSCILLLPYLRSPEAIEVFSRPLF